MTTTLKEATDAYLEYLVTQGKSPRTIYTYGMDLAYLISFLGADQPLEKISSMMIGKFLKSDVLLVNQRSEKPRSEITINKNIRVVRQFFLWAQETGRISTVPLPKAVPLGRQPEKSA